MPPGLLLLLTLVRADTTAGCPSAPPPGMITHRDVERMLAAVVARSFPELGGVEIEVNEIHSKRDFFTSGYDPGMALKKGRSRTYRVYVNPGLFRSPPSEAAIEAALAHELVHVVDYTRLSTAALEKFTLEYLAGNHAKYERATDLGALERGYGCGLIEYRRWLYGHVSPATVAAKRRDYLTPEEIEEWMERAGNGEQGTEEREKLGARSLHDTSSRGFPRTK